MPRFFLDIHTPAAYPCPARITGADAAHIAKALRMRAGETLTLCDGRGTDYACEIAGFDNGDVLLSILSTAPSRTEPSLHVTLYQGYPKGDKLEWIIQKAVELGAAEIVPVVTARSVARPEENPAKAGRKQERWQKIAAEAAGQCGRGVLPAVSAPLAFRELLIRLEGEPAVVFYEGGGESLSALVTPGCSRLSVIIGPEGGFAPEEIDALREAGARVATLGPRILRCETAPLAALSILMHLTGNME